MRKLTASSLLLLAVAGAVYASSFGVGYAGYLYEDVSLALFPSAERASMYGMRHLDYATPLLYDVDRAEYFYERARSLDEKYPYVYHQLSRIAFLRGKFEQAAVYIERQLALHGDAAPNAYYVRALIRGYQGKYAEAAEDYERFLNVDPNNWATVNDYAWVLLRAGAHEKAADATRAALQRFPTNAWLLNSSAIAHFEAGKTREAHEYAKRAVAAVSVMTEEEWLHAYPGNDPRMGPAGLATFKKAATDNLEKISKALGE